jgi:O-antigen ligase
LVAALVGGRAKELFRFEIQDWLFLGFITWVILGGLASGLSDQTREDIFNYVKWFVLFKLVIAVLGDVARARKFMSVFVLLVLILAVEAIQQKYSVDGAGWANQGRAWIDPSVLAAGGVGRSRWIGIFDGPGVFCVIFTVAFAFLLQGIGKENGFTKRLIYLAMLGLVMWATYCTGARGGFLASLAVFGLHILMRAKVAPVAIAVASGIGFTVFMMAPAYLTTMRDESNSSQYRVEMWAEGLEMIKQNPLLGIGRGNFLDYTQKLIAHNSAVELGGETGFIGLFLWFALLYASIKGVAVYRAHTEDIKEKMFCSGLMLAIIGYIVSSLFVTLEYETLYVLLAVAAVVSRQVPDGFKLINRDYVTVGSVEIAWLIFLQLFCIMFLG